MKNDYTWLFVNHKIKPEGKHDSYFDPAPSFIPKKKHSGRILPLTLLIITLILVASLAFLMIFA